MRFLDLFKYATLVAFGLVYFPSAHAATVSLSGGSEFGTSLQNQDRYLVDLGFVVPSLPASPNRALFEGGGDGDGTSITLIGNDIVVYLDDTDGTDTTFTVDVSSFAGKTVTIRLEGDYTGDGTVSNEDTAQIDVFDGSTTLTSGLVLLNDDHTTAAGGDAGGTGGRGGGSWPGTSESAVQSQFNTGYDIGDGDTNVLGPDRIEGMLYTGATDVGNAPANIPDPSTWPNLIPEPATFVMASLGLFGLAFLARRWK